MGSCVSPLTLSLSLTLLSLSLFLHPALLNFNHLTNFRMGLWQEPCPEHLKGAVGGCEVLASERFRALFFGNVHTDGHQDNTSLLPHRQCVGLRAPPRLPQVAQQTGKQ